MKAFSIFPIPPETLTPSIEAYLTHSYDLMLAPSFSHFLAFEKQETSRTYGSSQSDAQVKLDAYFEGPGVGLREVFALAELSVTSFLFHEQAIAVAALAPAVAMVSFDECPCLGAVHSPDIAVPCENGNEMFRETHGKY